MRSLWVVSSADMRLVSFQRSRPCYYISQIRAVSTLSTSARYALVCVIRVERQSRPPTPGNFVAEPWFAVRAGGLLPSARWTRTSRQSVPQASHMPPEPGPRASETVGQLDKLRASDGVRTHNLGRGDE
ncbi:hypothetical protein BDY21DRAFT_354376 [Lineolata rhizophorae]|uniref:Uncharacterized protein n=1 Tax=Lineolata rhizophorae TaxID=578093 RepID=A0A6A6NPZ0_9PEZI|nr:hypothetical protein BDY21DRAFT_354376 [Lineolata rhizophorae]